MITELAGHTVTPLTGFQPYPQAGERAAWEALDSDLKKRLIAAGEACLHFEYPTILATDFMEFSRNGNRSNFEAKQFKRRTVLNALVLAECVEYQGRFLDDIVNGIFSICGENAWQLPAHNSYIRDTPQLLLPDVTRPVIDLFSAETASVLAVSEYMLRDELKAISPAIGNLINQKIEERIIKPYLTEHFWWMGDGTSSVNNWTVWCTQNLLLATFTRPLPEDIRQQIFQKACRSIDYFLDEYGEDGCCDEGAQYYRHAGLCLFNSLEILNGISGGAFTPAFEDAKVKNIAAYIVNVHIDDKYYVNFADCSPVAGRCNAREFLFGKRTGNPELMAFAASDYRNSEDQIIEDEHNLFYRLQEAFTHGEMMEYGKNMPILHKDFYYESVGIFMTRDEHLFLAVKAGDNADSHNHNDTGSFTIYKDGKPMMIDVGVETYTKKTFSPQRYEIWTMQSQYHNLPTFFDGTRPVMQQDGEKYRASVINHELGTAAGSICLDIAGAYPDDRIRTYTRTATLKKGSRITICDHYEGAFQTVVLSLMFYEEPVIQGNTIQIGSLGTCEIKGAADITREVIPITDLRLKTAWDHDLYRCLITMEASDMELIIQ